MCRVVLAALLVAGSVGLVGEPAAAAPGESEVPAPNPDLDAACGLDILVILDESGSIDRATGATAAVRQAFTSFTTALQNTGSRMAVAEFNTVARMVTDPNVDGGYIEVTTATKANLLDPYINNTGGAQGYRPNINDNGNNRTNWEDAMRVGRYFAPPPGGVPHLTVFITDGLPNTVVRTSRVTAGEYRNKLPLDRGETQNTTEGRRSARPAIPNANALKLAGSHILTVAVGNGLTGSDTLNALRDVSGPDVYDGTGTFDIRTSDVFRVTQFAQLESALREAAFELCAPSVNVQKLVDSTPDPGTDDAVPAAGWTMTAQVDHPNGFTWVSPSGATGTSADVVTNAGGFSNFQWTPNGAGASTITVTEADTPGTGFENDVTETECQYRTPDQPNDQQLALDDSGDGFFAATLPEQSIVTCTFLNRALPDPGIRLEKATNGADADAAPGPSIPVGAPVEWTYSVTNTGNVTLDFSIEDAPAQTINCGGLTSIPPGQTYECTATGTAEAGQYENTATVTGTPPPSLLIPPVIDTDTSHYTGVQPGIDVEKSTNGSDSDNAPGNSIGVGTDVTWEYVVTNTGQVAIDTIALVDNQLGAITCPQTTLQPSGQAGDSMTCAGPTEPAQPGQYSNLATVTGNAGGTPVSDSDPSNYFGEIASIDLEKSTNGQDADTPTGPAVATGDIVAWTYVITNTGNSAILDWALRDFELPQGAIACPSVSVIQPGEVITCIARGRAGIGQYQNLARVSGTTVGGTPVSDDDPSHHIAVDAVLDLEKSTNGQDADDAPGVFVEVGDPVTWTYAVTMTGTDQVADVAVQDLPPQTITPVESGGFNVGDTNQDNLLEAGETWQFTASGTATPGQYTNLAAATGTGLLTGPLYAYDPSNYFGVTGGIDVEKSTNGVDADDPADAPLVALGDPVDWNYRVLNTTNTALANVAVTDDQGVTVTCPSTTLAVGASMDCTATGTATVQGLYANLATATGTDAAQVTHTDTDPSHYLGYVSAIDVEKSTNGQDADTPTGPFIVVGDTVTWTYAVTSGDLPVRYVVVTDDQGVTPVFVDGDTNGNDELDPGETWTYEATGTAVAGQYANLATATGVDTRETALTDTDPSHYYGFQFQANVQPTATNLAGEDHPFTVTATYDGGGGPQPVPDGSTISFEWTGDGAVTDPLGDSCTTTSGACTVTVSSPTPGSGTIEVTDVTATFGGTALTGDPTTTPPSLVAVADGSLTAEKTWIAFDVDITPLTASNPNGVDHTFTIAVRVDDGSGLAPLPIPANSGSVAWSFDGPDGVTTGSCTLETGGICDVVLGTADPGAATLTATSLSVNYDGVDFGPIDLTAPASGQSADLTIPVAAAKTWVDWRVRTSGEATNIVGGAHEFTLTLERNDGSGWAPAAAGDQIAVTWAGPIGSAITAVSAGTVATGGAAAACIVDANGECTVTVDSSNIGTGTLTATDAIVSLAGYSPAFIYEIENVAVDKTWVVFEAYVETTATNLVGDDHTFTIEAFYDDVTGAALVPDGSTIEFTWTGAGAVTQVNGADAPGATSCVTVGPVCTITVSADDPGSGTIALTSITADVGGTTLTGTTTASPPGLVPNAAGALSADKTWVVFVANVGFTATNLAGDDHVFVLDAWYDDGTGEQIVPNGSVIEFTWTGVGQVIQVGGADDLDATSCTTIDGSCLVTVSSATPGSGTIAITSVTATIGNDQLVATPDTQPPGVIPEQGGALTADKTWVVFDVEITPLEALNPVGEEHVFTIAVQIDSGNGLLPLAIPPDSATVDWSWAAPDQTTEIGTCTLQAGATCDVVRNSAVGGVGTLSATALDVVLDGVPLPTVDLSVVGPGQVPELVPVSADKTWVGYSLTLDPPTALNLWPTDPDHVVTLSLDVFPSDVQGAPIAGQSIDVTLASTVATITAVSDGMVIDATTATCITDASGRCAVTITSTGPGDATLSAEYDHLFEQQPTPIFGNDAEKTWRTFRVRVTPPDATNLLGDPHTFNVFVERTDDGTSWSPVPGARPSVDLTAPGTVRNNSCSSGTNSGGRCTVTVASPRPAAVTLAASYVGRAGGSSATFRDSGAKRWIDYRVSVTPPTAENLVDTTHVFTVTVSVNRGDGEGFVPLAGAKPSITRTGRGTVTAQTCAAGTGANGRCAVTIRSTRAGTTTVAAAYTGRAGASSASYRDAGSKRWVDYRLTLTPGRAINVAGDPHRFTVLLEIDRGSGYSPAGGQVVQVGGDGVGRIVSATPTGPRRSACRTNNGGQCTVTVDSDVPGTLTLTARHQVSVGGTTRAFTADAVKIWVPPELPSTGTAARDLLTVAGMLLVVGALLLVTSRRRGRLSS